MAEQPEQRGSEGLDSHQVPAEIDGKTLASGSVPTSEVADEVLTRRRKGGDIGEISDSVAVFAADTHSYIRDNIVLADQKAGFLFTIVAAMLAYLHTEGISCRWFVSPSEWRYPEFLAALAVLGLTVAAISALIVVLPRLEGSRDGLVFWHAIARISTPEDYEQEVNAKSADDLSGAKLRHCHELARVCRKKYQAVTVSLWCGSIGLGAAVVYLALVRSPKA